MNLMMLQKLFDGVLGFVQQRYIFQDNVRRQSIFSSTQCPDMELMNPLNICHSGNFLLQMFNIYSIRHSVKYQYDAFFAYAPRSAGNYSSNTQSDNRIDPRQSGKCYQAAGNHNADRYKGILRPLRCTPLIFASKKNLRIARLACHP